MAELEIIAHHSENGYVNTNTIEDMLKCLGDIVPDSIEAIYKVGDMVVGRFVASIEDGESVSELVVRVVDTARFRMQQFLNAPSVSTFSGGARPLFEEV